MRYVTRIFARKNPFGGKYAIYSAPFSGLKINFTTVELSFSELKLVFSTKNDHL